MKFHYRCCAAYLQKTDILVLGVGQMLCCKEQIHSSKADVLLL